MDFHGEVTETVITASLFLFIFNTIYTGRVEGDARSANGVNYFWGQIISNS